MKREINQPISPEDSYRFMFWAEVEGVRGEVYLYSADAGRGVDAYTRVAQVFRRPGDNAWFVNHEGGLQVEPWSELAVKAFRTPGWKAELYSLFPEVVPA